MILYFTGTGGSRHIAVKIGAALSDEVVSVNRLIKEGSTDSLRSEKPFVFVMPTYAWRIPEIVRDFILSHAFEGSRSAYFVMTCGSDSGNAAAYLERLCRGKGFEFRGLREIRMPENYIALFPVPDREQALRIIGAARRPVDAIVRAVSLGEPLKAKPVSFRDRLKSAVAHPLWKAFTVSDKGFRVMDSCVGCGLCAELCPTGNVTLSGGRPSWNGNCIHCMACICGCPPKAIEYKQKSVGKPRFFLNEKDELQS